MVAETRRRGAWGKEEALCGAAGAASAAAVVTVMVAVVVVLLRGEIALTLTLGGGGRETFSS